MSQENLKVARRLYAAWERQELPGRSTFWTRRLST